jgi:hypothetical protein
MEPVDLGVLVGRPHSGPEGLRTGLEGDHHTAEGDHRIAQVKVRRIALGEDLPTAAEEVAHTLVVGTVADHLVGGSQKGAGAGEGLHHHSSRRTGHGLPLRNLVLSVRRGRVVYRSQCIPAGLSEGLSEGLSFLSSSSSSSFIFFLRKSMVGDCGSTKVKSEDTKVKKQMSYSVRGWSGI